MGSNPPRRQTGRCLPRGSTRWMRHVADLRRDGAPRLRERIGLGACLALARVAAAAPAPTRRRRANREVRRCLAAFRLFRDDSPRCPEKRGARSLGDEIRTLRSDLGVYWSLWAVEGLGFRHGGGTGRRPESLREVAPESLPSGSLLPLHIGLGLALARRSILDGWETERDGESLERVVAARSMPGCEAAAIEGAGFLVRSLFPEYVGAFDEASRSWTLSSRELLWHGVGRALYLLFPRALGRCVDWPGWAEAAIEPPDGPSRRATQAGFVWALTLINLPEPGILEAFLLRHGKELDPPLLRRTVAGAALVWHAWAGRDAILDALLDHRPDREAQWRERVRDPVLDALTEWAARRRSHGRLEELLSIDSPHPSAPAVTCA
jgi:hypothetical protein